MEPKKKPGGWRYVKRPGAEGERLAAAARRMQAAEDHLNGKFTLAELAVAHGVAVGTIRDWVQVRKRALNPRRDTTVTAPRSEPRTVYKNYDIMQGAGGRMRDDEVRDASRELGRAIVALQTKLNIPTFNYRGRI